jgi:hypothetical protein
MAATALERRLRRRRRTRVVIVAAAIGLAAAGWIGVRGVLAAGELREVQAAATGLRAALQQRDVDAVQVALSDIGEHAARAEQLTGDPVWGLASSLPGVGTNFQAVHAAAAGAATAVPALDDVLATPGLGETIAGGDIGALAGVLRDASPALGRAATTLRATAADLDGIDESALLPPIRDGLSTLQTVLRPAADSISAAAEASRWVPSMLGVDGTREVLVSVQNSAELRAGGGLTGTFLLLEAREGRLEVREHTDSSNFAPRRVPVIELPASVSELYGDVVGTYVQNATMTPDFELSARLMRTWWQSSTGSEPDAVVAVDPVVLRSLLTATGPVHLSGGATVDAAGFVQAVLVDPYLHSSTDEQTALQREVVSAVVTRLLSGDVDVASVLGAIGDAVADGRVSVWSAHEDEQRHLREGPLSGMRARQLTGTGDVFSVLLNDATTTKLDSYLDMAVGVVSSGCRPDGRAEVVVEVRLHNNAPPEARGYPGSMTGMYNPASPGDIVTDVGVAAPPGWFFGSVDDGTAAVPSRQVVDAGVPTSVARSTLAPGDAQSLRFRFIAPDDAEIAPRVIHTPLLRDVAQLEPGAACA